MHEERRIDDKVYRKASEVSKFLMMLSEKTDFSPSCNIDDSDPDFFMGTPAGDIPYAMALVHWEENGKSADSVFSFRNDNPECPYLINFRYELYFKFGLPILTKTEVTQLSFMQRKIKTVYGP